MPNKTTRESYRLNLRAGLSWLILVNQIAMTTVSCIDFDLNQLPSEYEFSSLNEQQSEIEQKKSSMVDAESGGTATVAPAGKIKGGLSPQLYSKVERLFGVLKVCDTDNFDMRLVIIPDSFSAQNKAMMALTRVAKNLKKKDKLRYKRIMTNCHQLAQAVQARIAGQMSAESQTSGGDYSFMQEQLQKMNQSPLDNLRDRVASMSSHRNDERFGGLSAVESDGSKQENIKETQLTPEAASLQTVLDQDEAQSNLIKFL